MNRRDLLAATSGGTLLGLSGCLDSFPDSDSGNGDKNDSDSFTDSDSGNGDENGDKNDSDELEYPDHPGELESESARDYVTEYEEVFQTKSLQKYDYGNASCDTDQTVLNYQTDTGLYFTTFQCPLSYGSSGNGGNGAGDGYSNAALYLVTSDIIERIEPDRQEHDDPYKTEDQDPSKAHGVWLTNFTDGTQEMTLQIDHAQESHTVLNQTFELISESGIHLDNVIGIEGEYDFYVEHESGSETTKTFTYIGERSNSLPMSAVVITPEEDLIVDDIEFEEY